jgi:uncharacterized protein
MERLMIKGDVLNAGIAAGPLMVLTEPVSFWGAYDPRTGCIVDTHHPQSGQCLKDHILLLPETRGSGGTPGGIAEAIRRGTAPAGIVLITPDINLAVGAAVAARLYGKQCPVLSVTVDDYDWLANRSTLAIAQNGQITV